jgi:hypothetical protein
MHLATCLHLILETGITIGEHTPQPDISLEVSAYWMGNFITWSASSAVCKIYRHFAFVESY